MIRIIDTLFNYGTAQVNTTWLYNGNYGSDGSTNFAENTAYFWAR